MRFLFLLLGFFPLSVFARIDEKPVHQPLNFGLDLRYHSSLLLLRDPQLVNAGTYQTGPTLSPGFGVYLQPLNRKHIAIMTELFYANRGSGESVLFPVNNSSTVLHIANRYRTATADVQLRLQTDFKKLKPFVGFGGTCTGIFSSGYNTKDELTYWEQIYGSSLVQPARYEKMTLGTVFSAGVMIDHSFSFEISRQFDLTPVLNRNDVNVRMQTTAFSVKYAFGNIFRKPTT